MSTEVIYVCSTGNSPKASETWHNRIQHRLNIFHQQNVRKILGITCKDKITNEDVLSRTGQRHLQDIVAERRFRFAGHIIRLPQECPAHCTMDCGREEDRRRPGRKRSKRIYNYVESAGVKQQQQQQNVQDGDILLPIVLQRIGDLNDK